MPKFGGRTIPAPFTEDARIFHDMASSGMPCPPDEHARIRVYLDGGDRAKMASIRGQYRECADRLRAQIIEAIDVLAGGYRDWMLGHGDEDEDRERSVADEFAAAMAEEEMAGREYRLVDLLSGFSPGRHFARNGVIYSTRWDDDGDGEFRPLGIIRTVVANAINLDD